METVSGSISLVQENRFLLESDTGLHHLFIVSHTAPYTPEDLRAAQESHRRVTVHFTRPGKLIAGLASRIDWAVPDA